MFCQDLELQAALTGRKKPVLGQKKAANNFFDADHHFETHKIGFKDFDQQWDVPKRGLEPVKEAYLQRIQFVIEMKGCVDFVENVPL